MILQFGENILPNCISAPQNFYNYIAKYVFPVFVGLLRKLSLAMIVTLMNNISYNNINWYSNNYLD